MMAIVAASVLQAMHTRTMFVPLSRSRFESREPEQVVVERMSPGFAFTEVIPSWNVSRSPGAKLTIELRAHIGEHSTKWYAMGIWSLDANNAPRESVDGQKDEDGNVLTDTLRLASLADSVDLRLTVASGDAPATISLLALNFWAPGEDPIPKSKACWGTAIEVPQKAQGNYPNGGVMCSPTTTTMLLQYWSVMLNRQDLYVDVPQTIDGVWDRVYNGAGNWPFNMAFAGSFGGLRAYVSRLASMDDLAAWLEKKVPVACSVAFSILNGKPLDPKEAGHLVVLVGFTAEGDPVFNDPARRAEVRRTYKRADFEAAWKHSKRTVYLVYPENWPTPDL